MGKITQSKRSRCFKLSSSNRLHLSSTFSTPRFLRYSSSWISAPLNLWNNECLQGQWAVNATRKQVVKEFLLCLFTRSRDQSLTAIPPAAVFAMIKSCSLCKEMMLLDSSLSVCGSVAEAVKLPDSCDGLSSSDFVPPKLRSSWSVRVGLPDTVIFVLPSALACLLCGFPTTQLLDLCFAIDLLQEVG